MFNLNITSYIMNEFANNNNISCIFDGLHSNKYAMNNNVLNSNTYVIINCVVFQFIELTDCR